MKYTQHPLSASWSAMDEEAFKALIDDIDANGVRNPIVLYEGKILDGWHRYRACAELNVKKPPMIEYDGKTIAFNFSPRIIRQGYELAGVEMDAEAKAALEALREITESPRLGKSFAFERGQIQIVNNRQLGHRRTGYTDHSDPAMRRHLVRIWIRNRGRPFYMG